MRFSPHFRLINLFWLVLCFAAALAAYQHGVNVGFRKGKKERGPGENYTKVYDASFLVVDPKVGRNDFRELRLLVMESIEPESWLENGGAGELAYFSTNRKMVLDNYGEVHRQFADLLEDLRGRDYHAKISGKRGWIDEIRR